MKYILALCVSFGMNFAQAMIITCRYANVERVIDGDTIDMIVILGFNVMVHERGRLARYNAPETRTRDKAEKIRGIAAKERLQNLLRQDKNNVIVCPIKKGKYGRWIIELYDRQGKKNYNDLLINRKEII